MELREELQSNPTHIWEIQSMTDNCWLFRVEERYTSVKRIYSIKNKYFAMKINQLKKRENESHGKGT